MVLRDGCLSNQTSGTAHTRNMESKNVLIDLVHLRTFIGVAEEQHLTRAAERLHISQSAASSHVRAIEEILGTQLFVRTNRNLQLTRAGELVLDRARTLLNEASVFTSFARELRGKMEGRLVVCSSSDPSSRVADIISTLHQQHPLVHIDLLVRQSAGAYQDLKSGELDIGIHLGPSVGRGLKCYELASVQFCTVGPIAWKEQIEAANWEGLASMPWITPLYSGMAYSTILARLFTSRGLEPNTVMRFDNATLARSMMQAGIGLTLMRESHALKAEREGSLVISPIGKAELPLYISHLASRKNDPLIRAFMESARQVWPNLRSVE